jgi:hypothetical protein
MFQTKDVEKIKTHFTFNNFPFFIVFNCTFHEMMWKNTAEPRRSQLTMLRMRIAFWIPKATYKHSEYGIIIAFPLQYCLHERASVLRYTYSVCLVYYNLLFVADKNRILGVYNVDALPVVRK